MFRAEFCLKETKAKIIASDGKFFGAAACEIRKQRELIEKYITMHPEFAFSLQPVKPLRNAPPIAREMCNAGEIAGVGPMAAVAGCIAEFACRKMHEKGAGVALVENGGDIFAITEKPLKIALFAGLGHAANSLCFEMNEGNTPLSVCSSSSYMGHSLSLGKCDLATVFAKSGSIADAFATALCNRVRKEGDLKDAVEWAKGFREIEGAIAVKGGKIALFGRGAELSLHSDAKATEKITVH